MADKATSVAVIGIQDKYMKLMTHPVRILPAIVLAGLTAVTISLIVLQRSTFAVRNGQVDRRRYVIRGLERVVLALMSTSPPSQFKNEAAKFPRSRRADTEQK